MHHLLYLFFDILRLRKGPQALPTSGFLLGIVLGLHFLLGVILLAFDISLGLALPGAAVATGMVPAIVQGVLALRRLPHRFVQTATALAGSEFLLSLPTLPFHLWQHESGLTSAVSLLLVGWSLVVTGHIFRHALDITAWKGFAVAVGYFLISLAVAGLFVGPGA